VRNYLRRFQSLRTIKHLIDDVLAVLLLPVNLLYVGYLLFVSMRDETMHSPTRGWNEEEQESQPPAHREF
jgi:hypothetical protein